MSTEEQRLAPLREKIDALDVQILDLLTQRAKAAQEVGHVKGGFSSPVFRPERERQVVARLQEINQGPLLSDGIAAIWREVMSACRALEARQTIAYLGPVGTFSEQAAQTYFGHSIAGLPCASLDEVFKSVEKGAAQFGVVPVENSSEGAISRTLDLLLDSSMQISGEVVLPIRHHLLTKSGNLDGVTVTSSSTRPNFEVISDTSGRVSDLTSDEISDILDDFESGTTSEEVRRALETSGYSTSEIQDILAGYVTGSGTGGGSTTSTSTGTGATFSVTNAGALTATNATITGSVTANTLTANTAGSEPMGSNVADSKLMMNKAERLNSASDSRLSNAAVAVASMWAAIDGHGVRRAGIGKSAQGTPL